MELKLPSWVYYIISSIQNYGALNEYTSETYESLHKNYVKQPYRLSNKNNIEEQLMQAVCIMILKIMNQINNIFIRFEDKRLYKRRRKQIYK